MTGQSQEPQPEGKGGYQRLKEAQTLGEILNTAMSFENSAREFYRALATKVNKPLRSLVEELAAEEERHYRLFDELSWHPHVRDHISDLIKTPANDHRFSDYIFLPELGDFPDDQAILQYALGREHAAMEQYTALAAETPPGPAQDLFRFLAQEELNHKAELEKRYYELVYSGSG